MACKERYDWVDAARGLSIILIVAFHATDWLSSLDQTSSIYIKINLFFRPIRIPLFFIISGVLAARYMSLSWRSFISNRIIVFLYIYGVWSVINWIYFSQYSDGIHKINFGSDAAQLFTFWYNPILGLWFIWCLAIFYLITKLLLICKAWIVSIVASFISIIFFTNYFQYLTVPYVNLFWYFAFFYIGVNYGSIVMRYINYKPISVFSVCTAFYLVIGASILNLPTEYYKNGFTFGLLRFVLSVFGTAAGLAAVVLLCRINIFKEILTKLGKQTIYIYVINEMLVSLVSILFLHYRSVIDYSIYWSVPITVILVIALALGIKHLMYAFGFRYLYEVPSVANLWFSGHRTTSARGGNKNSQK